MSHRLNAPEATLKANSPTRLDELASRLTSQVTRLRDTNGHAQRTLDRLFGANPEALEKAETFAPPVATLDALAANENLKNFPFKHGCKAGWEPRANPFRPVLGGVAFGELSIITSGNLR